MVVECCFRIWVGSISTKTWKRNGVFYLKPRHQMSHIKNPQPVAEGLLFGAPGEIRTPDQVVRSHLLYPAELRVLEVAFYPKSTSG